MTLPIAITPPKPLPTLPTELIIDIFRNHSFSHSHFAHFALISRRFLSTIQALLYEKVSVILSHTLLQLKNGDEDDLWRLSMKTFSLLQTLQNRPDLAKFVRGIEFDVHGPEDTSEIVMGLEGAISTFFGLAQNASDVILRYGCAEEFYVVRDALRRFASRIKSFESDVHLEPEDTEFIHTRLTSLRYLNLDGLEPPETAPTSPPVFQLEEYTNENDSGETGPIPFLDHSAPTLRRLAVNAGVASSLDYKLYTNLHTLALTQYQDFRQASRSGPDHNDIWSKLSLCPSLEVLKLDGDLYDGVESYLFMTPTRDDEELGYRVELRQLRRIDIRNELPLNRLAFLLTSRLFPNLQEVGVTFTSGRGDDEYSNLLVGARAMCEARGIKVIFSGWYC